LPDPVIESDIYLFLNYQETFPWDGNTTFQRQERFALGDGHHPQFIFSTQWRTVP
ncbi:hypothetical protein OS493_035539, partial [Desmophyllum pertusum]